LSVGNVAILRQAQDDNRALSVSQRDGRRHRVSADRQVEWPREDDEGAIDPDKTMDLVRGMKFEGPRGPIAIDPATRDIILNAYYTRGERRNGVLGNYEFETTPMVKDPNES
jgi:hypothetical protein